MTNPADDLRRQILDLTAAYSAAAFGEREFVPGRSMVPVGGRVFDQREVRALVDASLDFWLTTGRFAQQFEADFSRQLGLRHTVLVNSGSSANLVALSCLTSPTLKDRRLKPGDEVLTIAAGFPTTVNPIFQNQLRPVFLDVTIPSYNVDVGQLEAALSPRTRAIILAHTLGNPFDLAAVAAFAKAHGLWLIEDCCDALGTRYDGRAAGTFGDLATFSFYPAHHITMGEGGAVATDSGELRKLLESFRDWGRDCWCPPGHDNTCGRRFDWQLGELPYGFDHKYTYSHVGYNLKLTDMQAAVGVAQLGRLAEFIERRKENFRSLHEGLGDLADVLVLPEAEARADPSWFGFPIGVQDDAPFTREQIIRRLDSRKIGTRLLFGGNLTRQPAYKGLDFRVVGDLRNCDWVMNRVFWIGVYPGLTAAMIAYVVETFHEFCRGGGRG
jgi:CDP-4-dehydro-6-deoxyglucose reductase, E1